MLLLWWFPGASSCRLRTLFPLQIRFHFFTIAIVALLFGVPRTTLATAIARTEREIERGVDRRGRPEVLTRAQVLDGIARNLHWLADRLKGSAQGALGGIWGVLGSV